MKILIKQKELTPNADIDCSPDCFRPYSFWIIREFNKYEVVALNVQLGGFRLDLKVYNTDRNSPFSNQQTDSEGSFGKIYRLQFIDQKIAIKSVHYSSFS